MNESDREYSGWRTPSETGAVLVLPPSRHYRFHRCPGETTRSGDCDIVFYQSAYLSIVQHLAEDTTREHGGLLLGYLSHSADASPSTLNITRSLRAQFTNGTRTSLTFTEETWLLFQQQTDELEKLGAELQRLGWYHSHPGLGIFLSPWDLDVCTNFTRPHHVALVVDPIADLGGFFVNGEAGYRPRAPQGFWECPDTRAKSVVTWKNTSEVKRGMIIPALAILPELVSQESEEMSEPAGDTETAGKDASELEPAEAAQPHEAVSENTESAETSQPQSISPEDGENAVMAQPADTASENRKNGDESERSDEAATEASSKMIESKEEGAVKSKRSIWNFFTRFSNKKPSRADNSAEKTAVSTDGEKSSAAERDHSTASPNELTPDRSDDLGNKPENPELPLSEKNSSAPGI